MYLDEELYTLFRKYELIETQQAESGMSALMQKCIAETASVLPDFKIAIVQSHPARTATLLCSSHKTLPLSLDRLKKAADLLKYSTEDTFLVRFANKTIRLSILYDHTYLCIDLPNDTCQRNALAKLSLISVELAIIATRKQRELNSTIVPKSTDNMTEFSCFFESLTTLFDKKNISGYSALIFIDFERFSSAKDFVRFSFNDDMLLLIQEHVSFGLNNNVMIARVEHDLLAVLLQDITPSESIAFEYVTKNIQHFRRKLKDHISIDSQKFFLTFKAGIRLFKPSDFCDSSASENAKALIKQTEFAMDLVTKESEVPYLFFTDELLFRYQRRICIENELKLAVTNDEFYLVYQPIFDKDNNIMGAEALLRWENKQLGIVSPAEFIPIAEQSGLVIEIGNLVAEQVCKALNSQLQNIKYISINVSCIQLKDSMYSDKLEYLLAKYPKSRGRLWIEITESVAMTYLKKTQLLMNELCAKGIRFMLDDFGTGHSSLAYLNELPLSTIKIDRCFISGVTKCKKKQAIVESIRKLSESFSLNCVAEGIENESDYTFLKTIGVDSFQGFLLSKPISQDELIKTLSI